LVSRADRWKSDSQANADALARRGRSYADPNAASISVQWDYHKRQPRDLRDACRMVRAAYADEVPGRMHNRDIADDGTPKMTPQAEAFIFGNPTRTDAGHDSEDRPLLSYYQTPFRATLANMERGPEPEAKRAAIVRHVTIGSQGPQEAAIAEGVPAWCAKSVAWDALSSFLRRLTDVRVDAGAVA
jgi:hypothetical protein